MRLANSFNALLDTKLAERIDVVAEAAAEEPRLLWNDTEALPQSVETKRLGVNAAEHEGNVAIRFAAALALTSATRWLDESKDRLQRRM